LNIREALSGTLSPLSTHDKNKGRIINFEITTAPADHLTKKFILNPVEGSRSVPTRISNQNQSVMG